MRRLSVLGYCRVAALKSEDEEQVVDIFRLNLSKVTVSLHFVIGAEVNLLVGHELILERSQH